MYIDVLVYLPVSQYIRRPLFNYLTISARCSRFPPKPHTHSGFFFSLQTQSGVPLLLFLPSFLTTTNHQQLVASVNLLQSASTVARHPIRPQLVNILRVKRITLSRPRSARASALLSLHQIAPLSSSTVVTNNPIKHNQKQKDGRRKRREGSPLLRRRCSRLRRQQRQQQQQHQQHDQPRGRPQQGSL